MSDIENGNGIVVSDLHLGKWGVTEKRTLARIHSKINLLRPTLLVLNGDIVEGRLFNNRPAMHRKIDHAVDQVRELTLHALNANPDCRIVYIYGNHDSFHEIRERLEALQKEPELRGHFALEESMLRCRDTIFLHGDLQVKYDKKSLLTKHAGAKFMEPGVAVDRGHAYGESRWKGLDPWHGVSGAVKRAFIGGISVFDQELSPFTFPMTHYAEHIVTCLKQHDPKLLEGVNRIMMGHIHAPFATKYTHPESGIEFLVTGPATARSKNTMYSFTIGDHALSNFEIFSDRKADAQAVSPIGAPHQLQPAYARR